MTGLLERVTGSGQPEGGHQVFTSAIGSKFPKIMRLPGRSAVAVSIRSYRCISAQRLRFATASFWPKAAAVLDRGRMKESKSQVLGSLQTIPAGGIVDSVSI